MTGRIVLEGISSQIKGLHWEFTGNLCIGRQASADLVLQHPTVCRTHAEICATPRGWMVRDVSQIAGATLVNGLALSPTPRRLQKNDVLQCGKLQLQVSQLEEEAPPARPASRPAGVKTTGEFVRVQAQSQRSWEEGLHEVRRPLAEGTIRPPSPALQFMTLLQGGHYLSRIHCARDFFQAFLDDTVAVLNAQRGAIVLYDDVRQEFQLRTVSLAKGVAKGQRCFSGTLARRCFFKGESILCKDIAETKYLDQASSVRAGDMGSILCMLLRTSRRRLGILHLDRPPVQEPFSQDDFALAEAIVASISAAMESALTVETQHLRLAEQGLGLARLLLEKVEPSLVQHAQRVSRLATLLGEELRLEQDQRRELTMAGLLHDLAGHPQLAALFPLVRGQGEKSDRGEASDPAEEDGARLGRILAVARALDEKLHPQTAGQAPLAGPQVVAWFRDRADFDRECLEVLEKVLARLDKHPAAVPEGIEDTEKVQP